MIFLTHERNKEEGIERELKIVVEYRSIYYLVNSYLLKLTSLREVLESNKM